MLGTFCIVAKLGKLAGCVLKERVERSGTVRSRCVCRDGKFVARWIFWDGLRAVVVVARAPDVQHRPFDFCSATLLTTYTLRGTPSSINDTCSLKHLGRCSTPIKCRGRVDFLTRHEDTAIKEIASHISK